MRGLEMLGQYDVPVAVERLVGRVGQRVRVGDLLQAQHVRLTRPMLSASARSVARLTGSST